ncbi:acetolactate synthase small subunit, partial [Pseudoalteromonas sp. S327]|uniref:acetolactate synthase small subunit n=1 Tax=Pseudoalteromonas sp. S327 TaxID=579535 RepID=UPI00110BD442
TMGDDRLVEQITKQVNKLVDVLKIIDLTEKSHIDRELLLVKGFAQEETTRAAVTRVVAVFQGAILHMRRQSYSIQLVCST